MYLWERGFDIFVKTYHAKNVPIFADRSFESFLPAVWLLVFTGVVLWCLQEAGGGPVPSQCNVTINDLMPTVPPWRPNIVIGQGIGGLNDNLTI